jgi:hypothetical protein
VQCIIRTLSVLYIFLIIVTPLQEEIKIEKNEFLKKIKQLEGKRNSLKCAKRNSQDQQVLQQGK